MAFRLMQRRFLVFRAWGCFFLWTVLEGMLLPRLVVLVLRTKA
jgi:hypothetical protein